jgi:superfamily II DNA helicase RecQ
MQLEPLDVFSKFTAQFHGLTDDATKQAVLLDFKNPQSSVRVIFATISFGLGLSIPDIKYVAVYGRPKSVSQYWQEVFYK